MMLDDYYFLDKWMSFLIFLVPDLILLTVYLMFFPFFFPLFFLIAGGCFIAGNGRVLQDHL